jgi:hypothetical protein
MKYDSYTRFLKSDIYKDCIRNEMQGKSICDSKQQKLQNNEERPNNYVGIENKLLLANQFFLSIG